MVCPLEVTFVNHVRSDDNSAESELVRGYNVEASPLGTPPFPPALSSRKVFCFAI